MKKHILILLALVLGINYLKANPIDLEKAKTVAQKFACFKFKSGFENSDVQLVYTGNSSRNETCFYVFNTGEQGFVIVSADDRFRPIVGYSNEGPFVTENMSPELSFYLDKIIEARTSHNAVLFDNTEQEWQSVSTTGQLLSRNRGRSVDFLVSTLWNQDSPYNLYAPEAANGPGGRCYAGCVATAMSQIMKYWDYPEHGTGSHTYSSGGWWGPYYPNLTANFGETYYDWDNMPVRINSSSPQEQIEAIATLMYHCGVAVEMGFSYDGSGANSEDVPDVISRYFSYSNHANLRRRESYSLAQWQNKLKESFDIGWPVYYSGYSEEGGHAFVCDGYDDNDLFHYNWGWGGTNDGYFVIDEIDYAGWAGAIFNFVPANVYDYMPLQPENLTVEASGDIDYAATLHWTNPSQNVNFNNLASIDRIVVTRNGEIIYTEDNVAPGADMTYTDHYMPAIVDYAVYAVSHEAKGVKAVENDVILGPTCLWTVEMTSSEAEGWKDGALSFISTEGKELGQISLSSTSGSQSILLPYGHVDIQWIKPIQNIGHLSFVIKNSSNHNEVAFSGSPADLDPGLFFIAHNTCEKANTNLNGPENLSISQSGNNISLSWEPLHNREVYHYQIYRDNLLFAITNATSFSYAETVETFHNYYVVALTEDGETHPSNFCNVQPESEYPSPTNLRYEMTTPSKPKISWDAPQGDSPRGYMVYRRPKGGEFKRVKLLTGTSFTDNLNSQPDSRYEYVVCACYTTNNFPSAYASSQEHPELNFIEVNKTIIPQHLRFFIHEGHVILQWDEATMAERYSIYRNGERIGHSSGTDFIDYSANASESYHYTVTGQTDNIESSASNEVYVDWTTDINEQGDRQDVSLYPNPTESKVYIEAEGLRQVRVINLMGQEVMNQTVNDNRFILDLSSQPKGCYFIETLTEQGSTTTKIMKL